MPSASCGVVIRLVITLSPSLAKISTEYLSNRIRRLTFPSLPETGILLTHTTSLRSPEQVRSKVRISRSSS